LPVRPPERPPDTVGSRLNRASEVTATVCDRLGRHGFWQTTAIVMIAAFVLLRCTAIVTGGGTVAAAA